MTDIRQLIHQSIEIEGLLKVLLDRGDDRHAADALAGRFGAFEHDIRELIQQLQTTAVSADSHLEHVGEREIIEPEKPQIVVPTDVTAEDSNEVEVASGTLKSLRTEDAVPAPAVRPKAAMPSLRSVLTLNDKFYFIREVFDGDESDFNATLGLLDDMDSYAEAEDYITVDMALDRNCPGVRVFLEFLSHNMNP